MNKELIKMLKRGASISWAPKNTGSRLIMFACRWMVRNTQKRAFVGYSDPQANEYGTIYQACNFEFLGDSFGNVYLYQHPDIKDRKTFSSQSLKRTSVFKRWCKQNGVIIQKEWFNEAGFKMYPKIPTEIKDRFYSWVKQIMLESNQIPVDKKGKYVLILGRTVKETKDLCKYKTYKTFPYPKRPTII